MKHRRVELPICVSLLGITHTTALHLRHPQSITVFIEVKHLTSSVQSTSHPLQLYLQRLPKGRPLFNQCSAKQLRNCLTNWVTGLPNPRLLGRGVSPQKLVYWLNCTLLKIRSLLSCYLLKIGVQYVLLRCTSCVLGNPHHAQIVKKELPALTHFTTGQSNF